MERGAWQDTVHGVTQSQTQLKQFSTHTHTHTHIHVSILFQIIFPFKLLQNIEQHSLCYTVGPCWLSISNIAVCIC